MCEDVQCEDVQCEDVQCEDVQCVASKTGSVLSQLFRQSYKTNPRMENLGLKLLCMMGGRR